MKQLRPYQEEALEQMRKELRAGKKRIMLCAPTGAGKTIMAIALMEAARQKGRRALFLADREVLVLQTSERLFEDGVPHGIIMSQHTRGRDELIQVASEQTLEARGFVPQVDLVIKDEAHGQRKFMTDWMVNNDVPSIGLSATPFTKGLGKTWQALINARTTNNLIKDGVLSRLEVYVGREIDMEGAKVSAGEWSDKAVAERAIPICGNIVSDYMKFTRNHFGGPVPTIVFSATVAHGEELCRHFSNAGLAFEQISYKDKSTAERQRKLRLLETNQINGLISCEALAKGYDNPAIKCVVMARPYRRSLASVIQAIGRGMRGSPEKEYALLLDHSHNYIRFAPEIERFFEGGCQGLDDGSRSQTTVRKREEQEGRRCRECDFVMPMDANICPMCGTARPVAKSRVLARSAEMVRYESLTQGVGDIWPHLCKLSLTRKPHTTQTERVKWCRLQHKDLLGTWPRWGRPFEPCEGYASAKVIEAVNESYNRWLRQKHAIRKARRKGEGLDQIKSTCTEQGRQKVRE